MRARREPLRYILIVDTSGAEEIETSALAVAQQLAEWATRRGVPLTWAVDTLSARRLSRWLNRRNDPPQDDALLVVPAKSWLVGEGWDQEAERIVTLRERLPERFFTARAEAQRWLPWAEFSVFGADWKEFLLIEALEAIGAAGLWGYRWNELSSRAVDRGAPFGFFYASRTRHQSAGPPVSTVVGVPRCSPPVATWRRMPPEPEAETMSPLAGRLPFSEPRPDEVAEILVATAECAELNAWNAVVHTLSLLGLAAEGEAAIERLSELWERVQTLGFRPDRLSSAVQAYRQRFAVTEPCVTFAGWHEPVEGGEQLLREGYFYDDRLQIGVPEGTVQPALYHNYLTPSLKSLDLSEPEAPALRGFLPARHRDRLALELEFEAPKPMPYALLLWEDHRHLRLLESDVAEVRWLGKNGLLLLFDLEAGINSFHVVLSI
ncbi:MAG: hypothetical protein KatS3mg115_2408 [Candidatus Poribacteria bacterium]|nr:MAG: hypothetical protein KatS3mg115_2408 [Candidatus Poribacteria bacterium]